VQSKHLDYLDGWRGLAITFLLIGHLFPVPGINFGAVGVNLFFVLSGLLMARVLFIQSTPLPVFYKRRIARIFPAVFVFIACMTLIYLAFGRTVDWGELVAASLFVINYFPGEPGKAVMPFGHIWSLSVEEHSYILLSFLAIAARHRIARPKVAIACFAMLFSAMGVYYWAHHDRQLLMFDRWIHSEVSAFGIFASAFLMLVLHKKKVPKLPIIVCPALVALGIVAHWWSIPAPVSMVLGVGAFAVAVNLVASSPGLVQSALSIKPLRQLGVWSFSIYLWQQPFYLAVHRNGMSPWLALGLAFAAGLASFYLVEQPARNYLNRKWGRAAPAAIPAQRSTA
jgi:peptidoglycan/LPS O-acetylase OafA/YrhL